MNWELDFTRPQMLITIKMITLAYNMHDHLHRKPEVCALYVWSFWQIFASKELSHHEKEKTVTAMPSLLEYYGYIYFFPSYFVGPAINFRDYKEYVVATQKITAWLIASLILPRQPRYIESKHDKEMPSTKLPTLKRFGMAILCILFVLPAATAFPVKYMLTNEFPHEMGLIARYSNPLFLLPYLLIFFRS